MQLVRCESLINLKISGIRNHVYQYIKLPPLALSLKSSGYLFFYTVHKHTTHTLTYICCVQLCLYFLG